jgi:uncharacterized protein YjbI with pentapeptide repeats
VAVVTSIVGLALAATLIGAWLAPRTTARRWAARGLTGRDLHDVAHDARTAFLQAGGVIAVAATIVGAAIQFASSQRTANRTLQLQARGQTRDTFSEAIAKLGTNDEAVQLGAIYTLGQLIGESHAYRVAVLNVLAAYVKEHNQYPPEAPYQGGPFPPVKYLSVQGENSPPLDNAAKAALGELREAGTRDMQGIRLDFTGASLDDADLEGLTAPEAEFEGAHINSATLTHTYLNFAYFNPARLHWTNLSDSCLRGTTFGMKTEPEQVYSDMQSAILERVDARNAAFRFVNLSGADFSGADLSQAVFDHADLQGANLSYTKLAETTLLDSNLRGADLTGSTGLTISALANDRLDSATQLPALQRTAMSPSADQRAACSGPFGRKTPLSILAHGR